MRGMWAYATATLRQAWRSPVSWVICALGIFAGWFATAAAVLAIADVGEQGEPLILSTGHLAGVLLTLWLIGRSLDEDRHSGFASSADATAPGVAGRVLGRWLGATLSGTLMSALVGMLIATSSALQQADPILLLSTSIMQTGVVAAWGLLLGCLWRGGGASLAVFLLWVLGHLPWGSGRLLGGGPEAGDAGWLEGALARMLGAVLPGPRVGEGVAEALGYTSAAVAGLLLLALASSRPADA